MWQAFWALHSDRPVSFGGPLPIPFSSLDRYATRYGVTDLDEFDRFAGAIGQMDAAFLKWNELRKPR